MSKKLDDQKLLEIGIEALEHLSDREEWTLEMDRLTKENLVTVGYSDKTVAEMMDNPWSETFQRDCEVAEHAAYKYLLNRLVHLVHAAYHPNRTDLLR